MTEPIIDFRALLKERLPDADHDLILLIIAATRVAAIVSAVLQQTAGLGGLEKSEHSVVANLWFAGPDHPLSPTELSQLVVQTTSGMTKTLRRLESAGLVERVPDPDDRRGQLVQLTSTGNRLFDRHVHQMIDRWGAALHPYDCLERERVASALWSFATLAEQSFLGRTPLAAAYSSRANDTSQTR